MAELQAAFVLIADRITPTLDLDPEREFRHWVLVQDQTGIELSLLETEEMPVHELLASLTGDGADVAAYITHRRPVPERVVAQVLVREPPDSDTRRADVIRRAGGPCLAPWEGPIS